MLVYRIQEAALARDWVFLCGKNEISPEVIHTATKVLDLIKVRDALGNMIRVYDVLQAQGIFSIRVRVQLTLKVPRKYPEHRLLMDVSYFIALTGKQCRLAEDRVWALRGLSTSSALFNQSLQHAPDMNSSYVHFSRYVLSRNAPNDGWWDWLDLAFTPVRTSTLPSWVPDFHVAADYGRFSTVRRHISRVDQEIRASRKNTKFKLGEDKNEVLFCGKMLDDVTEVLDELQDSSEWIRLDRFQALYLQCRMAAWMDKVDSYLDKRRRTHTTRDLMDKNLRHVDMCWRFVLRIENDSGIEGYLRLRSGLDKSREIAARYNDTQG